MLPQAGMKIPNFTIHTKTEDGVETLETGAYFAGCKVLLFAVPGAFTPTCSAKHLPNYLEHLEAIHKAGFDKVACLSINDAHVMKAWADINQATGHIDMLADMRGDFSRALGITADFGDVMAERTQRCAFIIDEGVVRHVCIEEPGIFEVSKAEHMLSLLD